MTDQQKQETLLNNRYRLEHTLGRGGMAIVYKAYDVMLERSVAIKVLRQNYLNDPEFQARFHQEAKAAANLTHPNIVTIHDFGYDQNKLFIVMEYVPGTDLKQLLRQKGQFDIDDALHLVTQACSGIGYAHRAGLVHCDVKPLNMLVTPDLRLKVTDFGIARALATIHPEEYSDLVWGSPQYFSPEQAAGKAPLPASDVYSLGVILFEMLTGRLPFIADDPKEYARLHREQLPPSPSQLNPLIPAELEKIMLKVLSKEPSARYRSADQFERILTNFGQATNSIRIEETKNSVTRSSLNYMEQTYQVPIITNLNELQDTAIEPEKSLLNFDWLTWGLGLLAFLLAGGLIPFWMYVLLQLSSTR
ncbi:MAG: protein kinase [Anaerolineaceae bacterium]